MVQQSIHLCRIKWKNFLTVQITGRIYKRFADPKGCRCPILPINQFIDKIHSNIESKLKHATLDGDTPLASRPCKISKTPYYLLEKNSLSPRMFFVSHLEDCICKAGRDLDFADINHLKFMIGSRGKDDCYIRVACVDI
jgi:hypothetical protein